MSSVSRYVVTGSQVAAVHVLGWMSYYPFHAPIAFATRCLEADAPFIGAQRPCG